MNGQDFRPFIEVEGASAKSVKKASADLGMDYSNALFGSIDRVYQAELGILPHIFNKLPEVTFSTAQSLMKLTPIDSSKQLGR